MKKILRNLNGVLMEIQLSENEIKDIAEEFIKENNKQEELIKAPAITHIKKYYSQGPSTALGMFIFMIVIFVELLSGEDAAKPFFQYIILMVITCFGPWLISGTICKIYDLKHKEK